LLKFKPGDLVKITGSVTIDRKNMAGSVALIVGLETDMIPKDLRETLNREVPYIIVVNEIETYVWEEEIELLEAF
jgi:hypothetical protein